MTLVDANYLLEEANKTFHQMSLINTIHFQKRHLTSSQNCLKSCPIPAQKYQNYMIAKANFGPQYVDFICDQTLPKYLDN